MPLLIAELQAVTRYIPACASSAGESYTVHVVACSSLLALVEVDAGNLSVAQPLYCLPNYFTSGPCLGGRVRQERTPFGASGRYLPQVPISERYKVTFSARDEAAVLATA